MKFFVKIILFFFLISQAAPSVLMMLDFEEEISMKNIEENENSKEEKELETKFMVSSLDSNFFFGSNFSNFIPQDYLFSEYQLHTSITIIPPKV